MREIKFRDEKGKFIKGHPPHPKAFGKGSKHSEESKIKIAKSISGKIEENSRGWKGNSASYVAIHAWLKKKFGKATKCENPNCKSKNPRRFEWASISRKWLRDIKDYIQLCPSCHRIFDINKLSVRELYGK